MKILRETGDSLSNPTEADWDSPTLSSLEEISAAAKSIGCGIEIRTSYENGEFLAKITPNTYEEVSGNAFVRGDSSVYGYLERVGGTVEPRCGLRIGSQPEKMIYCQLDNEELVRKMGPLIYSDVRVSGMVTWLRRTWRIKTIHINSVEAVKPVEPGSIRKALDAIWEAGGKAWDDVDDPTAVIKGMR